MKKKNLLFIALIGVLFVTGCNKTTKCSTTIDNGNYKVVSEYNITYDKNQNVVSIDTNEVVTSDDETILDYIESSVNSSFEKYKDLKYYNFNLKREKGKLSETIKVNYSKLDIDKFIAIDNSVESMFSNGKLKYDTIINTYKALGITCEEGK